MTTAMVESAPDSVTSIKNISTIVPLLEKMATLLFPVNTLQ